MGRVGVLRSRIVQGGVVWALSSMAAAPVRAAPFDPNGQNWESCSKLVEIAREELGPSRVDVTDELDYEKLGPTDGILLIHPQGAYDLDELSPMDNAAVAIKEPAKVSADGTPDKPRP